MKITIQNIKMLFCCAVLICLQSCATSKQKNQVPDQQKTEKELIYLRDTIFREGSTVTIVEHDTVKGKPRTITTTNTKVKVIRAMGQQKIVRDTVFLRSKLIKAQTAAISKAKKNKGSERKFPYKIAIPILILLFFITILIFAYDKQYFSIKSVLKRINVLVDKAASVTARLFNSKG